MASRTWMSKTSESSVGSLQLVILKFTTKKEGGDHQFSMRQSRRLSKPCVKISGSFWRKGISILHDNTHSRCPSNRRSPVTVWMRPHHPFCSPDLAVTTTRFLSWKNIWPKRASAMMTRWKMRFNASSTTWRRASMTWAYKNCYSAYKNSSTEMAIMYWVCA